MAETREAASLQGNRHPSLSAYGYRPSRRLERQLFHDVRAKTPPHIRRNPLFDAIRTPSAFSVTLRQAHLEDYHPENNPEGLGLKRWLANYKKEAMASTAGIRGSQNIAYPWDTRFPIHTVGMALATHAKALVLKEMYGESRELHKMAAREVRYNSGLYLDLIARVQAAQGITTHIPANRQTLPIWLVSFITFVYDLVGAEYVTSSHAISMKTATKDINDQGSQYLPNESLLFVKKIEDIFAAIERDGEYPINVAAAADPRIREDWLAKIEDGLPAYTDYLRRGVATAENLSLIGDLRRTGQLIIDNMGGCAKKTLSRVLSRLGIGESFEWLHTAEDPFFYGIGKYQGTDDKVNDLSQDTSIMVEREGRLHPAVVERMGYREKLKGKPIGTKVLQTDPDHDRLIIGEIESASRKEMLTRAGISYVELDEERIFTVYTPNQSFLMTMDFHAQQLKRAGLWEKHPRLMIKTTASAKSWDEWAENNGVKVINVPVGFKEIAAIMRKIEKQIEEAPDAGVIIEDVFGNPVNLGVQPRLVFAGEESGGMITGPEELIVSHQGRKAIAMREKSATEAIIITSALCGHLQQKEQHFSDYLIDVFDRNSVQARYDFRSDVVYYNESETDPVALARAKQLGEDQRTKTDIFFLSTALAVRAGTITDENALRIIQNAMPDVDMTGFQKILFVGDGTFLLFDGMFLEIRPSGTDAKTKVYASGPNRQRAINIALRFGKYNGDRTPFHAQLVPEATFTRAKQVQMDIYLEWSRRGAPTVCFDPPSKLE